MVRGSATTESSTLCTCCLPGCPLPVSVQRGRRWLQHVLGPHLVPQRFTALERGDVLQGDPRDLLEGLLGEERLVRSDEDVREGEQARQYVVLEDAIRQVFEEHALFFLVDVEPRRAKVPGLERVDD